MTLTWFKIARLGLVQAALGGIVVLTTSTLNRLMVIELALPAVLPGALVALHYGVQLSRPAWGLRSDAGGRRTPLIIGGMATLALGALLAAAGIWVIESSFWLGLAISTLAYAAIGLGVGAAGTSLLALLASATAPARRPAAATVTWLMMIFGIAVTAGLAGSALDPYGHAALMRVTATICAAAFLLTVLAVWGVERSVTAVQEIQPEPVTLRKGLEQIWSEPRARDFTLFVALSMVAYFMQELILEPFAGLVFHETAGRTTELSGMQNGGVFLGMLAVGIGATWLRLGTIRTWVVGGCIGSAAALVVIAAVGASGAKWALAPSIIALGVCNGVFAVAAIGAMMQLAGEGRERRSGGRMGLWGSAQALAAGFGGLLGAGLADALRLGPMSDAEAFGTVFLMEAALFAAAAVMAARILAPAPSPAFATFPSLTPGE
jgi:BCD family chlorophyll transporter-like MFS transporter